MKAPIKEPIYSGSIVRTVWASWFNYIDTTIASLLAYIGATRLTKGVDTTDYVIIDLATAGVVFKDTQAVPHYWLVNIDPAGSGALVTTDLGTVKP